MDIRSIRAILSTILILTGVLSFSTGAILYFLPYGMWLGLTRKLINDVHAASALVMGIAVALHLILNRGLYKQELQTLFGQKGEEPAEKTPDHRGEAGEEQE